MTKIKGNRSADRPAVSVIVPTLNGGGCLRELLASLTIQTISPDEVLVIDSESEDETVEIAREYGAQVQVIKRDRFDHGGSRSAMAEAATGEILLFFTQDVILAHRRVIELLIRPLVNSEDIAVSYARQLPAFDAQPVSAHLRAFNYPDTSITRSYADRLECGLETVFNSNSCAAYLKHPLSQVGYFSNGLIFGEDTCAAGRLLENGFRIAYVAEAEVYHSHNYSWSEEFRRYFDIGVLHSSENWLLATYGSAGNRGRRYVRSGISYLYNSRRYSLIGDFMVRVALKLIGYHLGRRYRILPRKMLPVLSMHKRWWRTGSES